MAGDGRTRATIEDLISSGAIVAHKDGNYGSKYPRVEEFGSEGVPFLTAKSLRDGFVDIAGAPRLGYTRADELTFGFVKTDDVLLSHNATIGRVAVVPEYEERLLVGTSLTYFRLDPKKLLPRYFAVYLAGVDFQNQLVAVMSHSTRNQVPVTAQRKLSVVVPPLPEQRAIAHILGTLDDKIELNRRRNQTLEAMARALFKDWFVDFGPVRAKMEGREPYLPADLWQLFPDRLDDEGKPEGWEMLAVGECFNLTMGQSPPGDTYNDIGDGLPFFQGRTDFGFRYPENRKFCSAPTRIADAEDTLVSVRAPVGDINLAWEKCCIGRGVAALRHLSGARSFTYHAIWSIQDELRQYEHTGTVFGAINKKQFESIGFINPRPELVESFEKKVSPVDSEVRNNIEESRTLAQLRDTLLPKLISGELRIVEAENLMEAIV